MEVLAIFGQYILLINEFGWSGWSNVGPICANSVKTQMISKIYIMGGVTTPPPEMTKLLPQNS